jgi:hypothetical protein
MSATPCYPRITFLLIVPLWFATTLNAQQIDRRVGVSLTVDPARVNLSAGQTQKFSAHIEGAPAGAVIVWAVPDRERDVSSISQDGVFTARIVGVYHVFAFATTGESSVLKTAVVKVTVLGRLEF